MSAQPGDTTAAAAPRDPRRSAPPHAPVVGRSRRVLGRFHVTGVFWYRFHSWGVSTMPSWAVGPMILVFTSFFFLVLRGIGRAIGSNLEAVLGPAGSWRRQGRIWRTMWNQAWCNSERYERLGTRRRFEVEVEGRAHWDRLAADPRQGLVLVTAHVGAWDIGSFLPSVVEPRPVHVVREQEMDPEAQKFVEEVYARSIQGHFTLHFARDNPALGAVLLSALRRGELVGLQGDRPSSTGRSVAAELFGRPFDLPAGPAALGRAARVPLLPVFCFRAGRRRYRLVIRPPIEPAVSDDRTRDFLTTARAVAKEVEWAIRERPHQWFCFRKIW